MFDYPIFPTESFLLGVCIGEYDANHACWKDCTLRFIEHLQKRLIPFYPDFKSKATTETRELSNEEANDLDNITWLDVDDRSSVGWRDGDRSRYYMQFLANEDSPFPTYEDSVRECRWIGPERRSLLDLLVDFVSPYMAFTYEQITLWNPQQHPMTHPRAMATKWAAIFGSGSEDGDITREEVSEESPRKISVMISKMVDDCGDTELFKTGHDLGWLIPQLEVYEIEPEWHFDDERDRQRTIDGWTQEIDTIRQQEAIKKCHYADLALKDLHHFYDLERITGDINHMDYLESFWMAIGEILGVLRSIDDEARLADAEGPTPRSLLVHMDMDNNMIRRIVRRRELELISDASVTGPEVIVETGPAIDTLAKRFWNVQTIRDMPEFLRERLGRENSQDCRRFAGIARNLHLSYRNPTQHGLDNFDCTIREAKYFLNGIHVLLDFCDARLAAQ